MDQLTTVVVVLGVILFSMVLHELAHGMVAYLLGDDTAKVDGRLTLNPLKHLDPWMSVALPLILVVMGGPVFGGAKPVPVDSSRLKHGPWGMALVALAGPVTNFLIALAAFLVGHYTGWLYMEGLLGEVFLELVMVNLGFGVFNLIPIPPLDGSRVLYAIAPDAIRAVMSGMEQVGIVIVMALVVALPGVTSGIIGGAMQGVLDGFYWLVGVR